MAKILISRGKWEATFINIRALKAKVADLTKRVKALEKATK